MPRATRKSASKPRTRRKSARKAHHADTALVVNVHEAKTQLSRLLGRVERGERITIARAGKPVAEMGPPPQSKRPKLSPDDPLLRVEEYAFDGPVERMTNDDIDRIVYGL